MSKLFLSVEYVFTGLCSAVVNSACLVNRGSLVQIRVAANIEVMQIRIVIMFTKFICRNYFYPLYTLLRGFIALWLKRLSCKQGIPASNPGSSKY